MNTKNTTTPGGAHTVGGVMELVRRYAAELLAGSDGNTRTALLAAVEKLVSDRDVLLEALKNLLEDTQHKEHEDCEDGPCPVRDARAAIQKVQP